MVASDIDKPMRKGLPWVLSCHEAGPDLFATADTLGYLLWSS
jgi:hypothetical protein